VLRREASTQLRESRSRQQRWSEENDEARKHLTPAVIGGLVRAGPDRHHEQADPPSVGHAVGGRGLEGRPRHGSRNTRTRSTTPAEAQTLAPATKSIQGQRQGTRTNHAQKAFTRTRRAEDSLARPASLLGSPESSSLRGMPRPSSRRDARRMVARADEIWNTAGSSLCRLSPSQGRAGARSAIAEAQTVSHT